MAILVTTNRFSDTYDYVFVVEDVLLGSLITNYPRIVADKTYYKLKHEASGKISYRETEIIDEKIVAGKITQL